MRYLILIFLSLSSAFATLNVQTTYTTLGEIVKRVGGEHVKVNTLSSPHYDPHFIVPKPSLISKLRRADILVISGAGLELGWLPPLLKGAHNGKIRPGASGFIDVSNAVVLSDVPVTVSRAFGDVHSQGNPHYMLDPYNVAKVATFIAARLSAIDEDNALSYQTNLETFLKQWQVYLNGLDAKMQVCKDKKVVQYHELFNYFLSRYGYKSYGNIEPLPGVSPSSKHTLNLINTMKSQKVQRILQDVYHDQKTGKFISNKTDAQFVVLPHDVKAVDEADSLENFYNVIARRLCQ